MILKIKNKAPDSWKWIDDVRECTSIPCKIKDNPDYEKEKGLEFIVESQIDQTVYLVDRFFRWPLNVGDCVNIVILHKGKGSEEIIETIVTEYSGVYILGFEGKTLDRI